MSLADLRIELRDGVRGSKRNRDRNRDNRNNNQNNGDNNRPSRSFDDERKSNREDRRHEKRQRRGFEEVRLRNFDDDNDYDDKRNNKKCGDYEDACCDDRNDSRNMSDRVATARSVLDNFLVDYTDPENLKDVNFLRDLITGSIVDVANVMKYYGDEKYKDCWTQMNGVLNLMSTQQFAQTFFSALKSGEIDNWDNDWNVVAQLISTLIATSRNSMKDDTIRMYIWDMLASKGFWGIEIEQIVNNIHVSKELAVELVIKIPVPADQIHDREIERFYVGFLDAVLTHAEDNIETLDHNTQAKLFQYFFGNGKVSAKVIGRYLTDPARTGMDPLVAMVYEEFKVMLWEQLEKCDINIITMVLKYVAQKRKENPDRIMLYDPEDVAKYNSIRKAAMGIMSKESELKDYLA